MPTVRKIFEFIKDLLVYPSKTPTIEVVPDEFGGNHRYRIRLCKGFRKSQNTYLYDSKTVTIQFMHKLEDGSYIPGLQSEQLGLVLLDRAKKLDAKFPCEQNKKQIAALEAYLAACKERVEDRISRDVIGEHKE